GGVGRPRGVVDRVGQVAHEAHAPAVPGHLPQAERPADDAHVGVHAHQDDVGDPAGLDQVPDLLAGVADRVVVVDLDRLVLALPGAEVHLAGRGVVAAAVAGIDGHGRLVGQLLAPGGDVLRL